MPKLTLPQKPQTPAEVYATDTFPEEPDTIIVEGLITAKREKAVAFAFDNGNEIWMPRSVIVSENPMTIKKWFYDKKHDDIYQTVVSSELNKAAEDFQRRADAAADLNLYDQACRKITELLAQRKALRTSMSAAKANSEQFWDLKRSLDTLDDQFYYWQGEKRDLMIEKQVAAMERLTAALENRT